MAEPTASSSQPLVYSATPYDPPADPATGSVTNTWATIGVNPTRQRIASAAQATTPGWLQQSFIAIGVLAGIASVADSVILIASHTQVTASGSKQVKYVSYTPAYAVASLVLDVIASLAVPLLIALALAIVINPSFGAFRDRFQRALRPAALATVPYMVLNLVLLPLSTFITTIYTPGLNELASLSGKTDQASTDRVLQLVPGILGYAGLDLLVASVGTAYATVLFVQSGAVSSHLNRWAVFGIMLLSFIVYLIARYILSLPLGILLSH